jgi:purine-binding chemotaxis protein CheW
MRRTKVPPGKAQIIVNNVGEAGQQDENVRTTPIDTFRLSLEEKRRILKARAKALARETETEERSKDFMEVVEFVLANETYGIESSFVREVYMMKELTPVPCTPGFVLGITNVRGQILSVFDIKKFFNLTETGLGDRDRILVVEAGEIKLGLLADAVQGVRSIPLEDIQSSLPTLVGIRQEYLKGITRDRTVILDAEKLLGDRKLVIHEEVET